MYYESLLLASGFEVHGVPKAHQTYKALLYPAWLRPPVDRPPPRRLVTRTLGTVYEPRTRFRLIALRHGTPN